LAERTDITCDWSKSPRIIWVNWTTPETRELTLQDLTDTIRGVLEVDMQALDDPTLLIAEGKAELGGGQSVAITATLLNAVVAFRANDTVVSSGLAAEDLSGTILVDTGATFVSDGVTVGARVCNYTDKSVCTVLTVLDETTLWTTPLAGGVDNHWDLGDAYAIFNVLGCSITGGNLVALDELGNELKPFLPTANVSIDRTSSASATVQELDAIQYSSYEGKVHVVEGGASGTAYPIGTPRQPVGNLSDAVSIAVAKGFTILHFMSGWIFPGDTVLIDLTLEGEGTQSTLFTFEDGCVVGYCTIQNACATGWLDGVTGFIDAHLENLGSHGLTGPSTDTVLFKRCLLAGTFTLPSNFSGVLEVLDSWSLPLASEIPVLDMGNCGTNMQFRNYSGRFMVKNCTQPVDFRAYFVSGGMVLDSTVTAGNFLLAGVGTFVNYATSVTSLDTEGFLNKKLVATAVHEEIGEEIEYAAYNGEITIDAVNGTDSAVYPYGTVAHPCKTLLNVHGIFAITGIRTISILGSLTITGVPDGVLDKFMFHGTDYRSSFVTVDDCQLINCLFRQLTVSGVFHGGSSLQTQQCQLGDLKYVVLDAWECFLSGTIDLEDTSPSNFYGCTDGIPGSGTPVINANTCESVGIWGYYGGLKIANMVTVGCSVSCNVSPGRLIVDSSDTQGSIIVRGVGSLQGTTGGTTVNSTGLLDQTTITSAVWDVPSASHVITDSTGEAIGRIPEQPASAREKVIQGYTYDPSQDNMTGVLWLESDGQIVSTVVSASVTFFTDSGISLFTLEDISPDPQGIFKVTKSNPGFSPSQLVYAQGQVVIPGPKTITSVKALSAVN
jgi:hypothetical protein